MADSKKSAWDGYRKWRKALWLTILGIFILAVPAPDFPGVSLGSRLPNDVGVLLIFTPPFLCLLALQHIKCPKCEKSFFYDGIYTPWANHCVHCGLPKWDDPPPKPAKVEIHPIPDGNNSRPDPLTVERLRLTNFLTLVLRDDPGAIGLRLDSDGWVDLDKLVTRANRHGIKLSRESLIMVLTVSENHRFELDQPGNRIRWDKC